MAEESRDPRTRSEIPPRQTGMVDAAVTGIVEAPDYSDISATDAPPVTRRERLFSRKVMAFWALLTIAIYVTFKIFEDDIRDAVMSRIDSAEEFEIDDPNPNPVTETIVTEPTPLIPAAPAPAATKVEPGATATPAPPTRR